MRKEKEKISSSEDEEDNSDNSSGPAKTTYNGSIGNKSSGSDSDSESSRGTQTFSQLTKSLTKESPKSSKSPSINVSPLERFSQEHPDFKQITIDEELSDNDEIAILELPYYFDPNKLLGHEINQYRKTKIKVDGVKYSIRPSQEEQAPILLLTKALTLTPVIAKLHLQEYVKSKKKVEIWTDEQLPYVDEHVQVELPDKLKDRHPIFGVDYKTQIELNDDIQKRLTGEYIPLRKKKHKKKKKTETTETQSIDDEILDPNIMNLLESFNKRGARIGKESISSTSDADQIDNRIKKKKSKKSMIKQERESEENIFNGDESTIYSTISSTEIKNESLNSHERMEKKKEKKKKKDDDREEVIHEKMYQSFKSEEDAPMINKRRTQSNENDFSISHHSESKSKKKKLNSVKHDTTDTENKKEKEKVIRDILSSRSLKSQLESEEETPIKEEKASTSKKQKKKRNRWTDDATGSDDKSKLISEILSSSRLQFEEPIEAISQKKRRSKGDSFTATTNNDSKDKLIFEIMSSTRLEPEEISVTNKKKKRSKLNSYTDTAEDDKEKLIQEIISSQNLSMNSIEESSIKKSSKKGMKKKKDANITIKEEISPNNSLIDNQQKEIDREEFKHLLQYIKLEPSRTNETIIKKEKGKKRKRSESSTSPVAMKTKKGKHKEDDQEKSLLIFNIMNSVRNEVLSPKK